MHMGFVSKWIKALHIWWWTFLHNTKNNTVISHIVSKSTMVLCHLVKSKLYSFCLWHHRMTKPSTVSECTCEGKAWPCMKVYLKHCSFPRNENSVLAKARYLTCYGVKEGYMIQRTWIYDHALLFSWRVALRISHYLGFTYAYFMSILTVNFLEAVAFPEHADAFCSWTFSNDHQRQPKKRCGILFLFFC